MHPLPSGSALAGLVLAATILLSAGQAAGGMKLPDRIKGTPAARFLSSAGYLKGLADYVLKYERAVGACATATRVRRLRSVHIARPVVIPKVGLRPQWIEMVEVAGCKARFVRPVFTVLFAGDRIAHVALLRGTSRTDPVLQWDIIRPLLAHARASAAKSGCKGNSLARLLGAKFAGKTAGAKGAGWREIWAVSDCRGVHEYAVSLRPSPGGGTDWSLKRRKEK